MKAQRGFLGRGRPGRSASPGEPIAEEEPWPETVAEDEGTEEEDLEPAGQGAWLTLLAVTLSLGIIGWGVWTLREVVRRGYLDQLRYDFRDVSLLPEARLSALVTAHSVRIFFTHDGRTLTPSVRRLRREVSGPEKARLILEELFAPPRSAVFRSALPPGTRSRGFYQIGRIAYLDLSEEFLSPPEPTPEGERLAVYALVNSIVLNDPGLDGLQLMVNGYPIETAWGWLDCSSPLAPNLSIVQ